MRGVLKRIFSKELADNKSSSDRGDFLLYDSFEMNYHQCI